MTLLTLALCLSGAVVVVRVVVRVMELVVVVGSVVLLVASVLRRFWARVLSCPVRPPARLLGAPNRLENPRI